MKIKQRSEQPNSISVVCAQGITDAHTRTNEAVPTFIKRVRERVVLVFRESAAAPHNTAHALSRRVTRCVAVSVPADATAVVIHVPLPMCDGMPPVRTRSETREGREGQHGMRRD